MDVSIIVPLYYGKRFLPLILKNVKENYNYANELGKYEIQLILVNDSPEQELDPIEAEDVPVTVITNSSNKGIHYSRVAGLEAARGDYILFLDQDDAIAQCYIYSQLSGIGDADAVVSNGIYRDNRLILQSDKEKERITDKEYYITSLNGIVSPGQVLIKKESIPQDWKENILKHNYCDDAFLWILMKSQGKKFEMNDDVIYFHREDGQNTSFNWKNAAAALTELYEMVKSRNMISDVYMDGLKKTVDEKVYKFTGYDILERKIDRVIKKQGFVRGYWENCGYRSAAIYGYGVYGKKLFKLFEACGIEVLYFVDRNAEAFLNGGTALKRPDDELEEVDVMLVSTIWIFDEVKRELESRGVKNIISMDAFLNNILNTIEQ